MAIDFEKYPKYLIPKHGQVIQNILNNAETVFGMNAETSAGVALKTELHGGELIRNDEGHAAVFSDAFNTEQLQEGVLAINLPEATTEGSTPSIDTINVAIANFANIEMLQNLVFNDINTEDLVVQPTPTIVFDTEAVVPVVSITGSDALEFLIKEIKYNSSASTEESPLYYYADQNLYTLSECTASTISSIIDLNVIALGDGFTSTNSSESNTLKAVFLAPPQFTSTGTTDNADKYLVTCPDYNAFAQITPEYSIEYYKFDYDSTNPQETKTTVTLEPSTVEGQFKESIELELGYGTRAIAKTTGTTLLPEDIKIIPSSETVIYGRSVKLSSAPALENNINHKALSILLDPEQYRGGADGIPESYTAYDGTIIPLLISYEVTINGRPPVIFNAYKYNDQTTTYQDAKVLLYFNENDEVSLSANVSAYFYSKSDPVSVKMTYDPSDDDLPIIDLSTAIVYDYTLESGWSDTNS